VLAVTLPLSAVAAGVAVFAVGILVRLVLVRREPGDAGKTIDASSR
jgi:hypothetical protein